MIEGILGLAVSVMIGLCGLAALAGCCVAPAVMEDQPIELTAPSMSQDVKAGDGVIGLA